MSGSARLLWEASAGEWWLAAGFLALAGWSLWRARGEARWFSLLRAAALIALALAAAKPAAVFYSRRAELPKVAVLVDVSHGMGAEQGGETDLDRARRVLERLRPGLEAAADARLYAVGQRAVRVDWDSLKNLRAEGPLDLGAAVDDLWRENGESLAAVWLLSDGSADRSADLNASVSRLGCPFYVLGLGDYRGGRGLSLDALHAPDFAYQHMPFTVPFQWSARGLKGTTVRVRVLHDGALVASSRFTVARDFQTGVSSVTVVSSALGTQAFNVEFAPDAPGAASLSRAFSLETVRQKLRILYLAGHPSFEYAPLRQFLKSNPNYELVSFVILRNPENFMPVPDSELSLIPFPAQDIFVTTLDQFDLFILEDFSTQRFGLPPVYLEYLKAFVQRGGGLLLIGGEEGFAQGGYRGTPLEDMLPVDLQDSADSWKAGPFKARAANPGHPLLNIEGDSAASAAAWGALPAMNGLNQVAAVRPGSEVLLEDPDARLPDGTPQPVLSGRPFGRGRVLLLSSPSTFLWKLGAGLKPQMQGFYEAFWQRAVQYLTGSLDLSKVRLAPPAQPPSAGEPFTVNVTVLDETFSPMADPGLQLTLRVAGGGSERVYETRATGPGAYAADIPALAAGTYTVSADAQYLGKPWGRDARTVVVKAAAGDVFNRVLLEDLALRTKGAYADRDAFAAKEWLDALPKKKEESSVKVHTALWASSGWLWAVLACLFAEWALRRRLGYW